MTPGSGDIGAGTAQAADVPALKALWHAVFGDPPEDIDDFFETYFSPDLTAVIAEGCTPVAAAYVMPDGDLVLPDGKRFPCAMIYAVAVEPDKRGLGYGAAVSRTAGSLAARAGYPAVVLKPAEDKLFNFYEKHTDFRPFFNAYESALRREELASAPLYTASSVTPDEYRKLRNTLLAGTAYIDADERALAYQARLCKPGGLYVLRDGGAEAGCAIVERDGGNALMKELLPAEGCRISDAVSSIAALLGAERYLIRTPTPYGETRGMLKRFGMMLPFSGMERCLTTQFATWFGPAFD